MINRSLVSLVLAVFGTAALAQDEAKPVADYPDQLLWGDTHLHTSYSFDAYLNQNLTADPDTAYRWAKGQPVVHPFNRTRVQIDTPLDFLVVSDHAELMGVIRAIHTETDDTTSTGFINAIKRRINSYFMLNAIDEQAGRDVFTKILPVPPVNAPGSDPVQDPSNVLALNAFGDTLTTETTAWNEIVDAAERHNKPGEFTSLIGWEWSSIPVGSNLHRVVFTPDGGEKSKQFLPYGSDQSQYPEDLWAWLDETGKRTGSRFLAIPHNSNISKGYMFAETTLKGEPITAEYARKRMLWEPIVEVTQIKGDSETHPLLSPEDEFADFESYEFYIQQKWSKFTPTKADFIRPALLTGLSVEQKVGVNPFKFGLIGSTDSHTGLSSAEETNFWGKMATDSTPATKRGTSIGDETAGDSNAKGANGWNMAAQGLAAVWANDNTRDDIYAAFKRKEVYSTSGPRIALRVFAGWGFTDQDADSSNFAQIGYSKGVPMGSDILANSEIGKSLEFLIRATKDPKSANLDRLQVVKGWVDANGQTHEKIFNVAWSQDEGRSLDAAGKLPAVKNTVNLENGRYENSVGSSEFSLRWQDPTFNVDQSAFYYVRVLEIPTARHSMLDGLALGIGTPEEAPATIQERAYSSPIWYTPSK